MKTPDEFLTSGEGLEYFPGEVYGAFAYPYEQVVRLLTEYGKLVQQEQIKLCVEHVEGLSYHDMVCLEAGVLLADFPRVLPE